MKDDFIIRKANIKDLEDILRLNYQLFQREYKKFDKSLDLNWTYSKKGKKCFKERIAKRDGFVEVVENKNKIIGYLCGGISERLFYRKKAKYAELESILIESKFRGKSLGTKLTKDFIDWCKRNKVDYVSVNAFAKNELSLNLYRKFGFKDYNLSLEMKLRK